jgi:hypothetical protein
LRAPNLLNDDLQDLAIDRGADEIAQDDFDHRPFVQPACDRPLRALALSTTGKISAERKTAPSLGLGACKQLHGSWTSNALPAA